VRVLVDEAVEGRSSADVLDVEIGPDEAGIVRFVVGDALGDALVRPGRIVVRLVFSEDGAQVLLADDQHAVQELATQGSDQAFTDRVHARSLDSSAQDPGAAGLEDRVERGGEIRSAVADQELGVLEPLAEDERGCGPAAPSIRRWGWR